MEGFNEYPVNMPPQDALIVRSQAEPQHTVVKYSAEELSRTRMGPANPFKEESAQTGDKRKSVPAGTAHEIHLSEHGFRSKYRRVETRDADGRAAMSSLQIKEENARIRAGREKKGDATIADGPGSYVGPWAKHKQTDAYEEVEDEEELGSDEEYEIVEEADEDVIESGTLVSAPAEALAKRTEVAELGDETTIFHGSQLLDYQGRTYMHVPQDLDIDLRKEIGSITNYIPRKLVHTWKSPTSKPITSMSFFPNSGHLLLSGSADNTLRLWDVYHERELLRSYNGHMKAITDLSFNRGGTQFVSGSHDRLMKLWDTETGHCLSKYTHKGKTPHCLEFNPTSEHSSIFLAGMSDANILAFDTRTGAEPVQEYNHHLKAINTLTFVENGQTFMSTSDDKSIRCWNWDVPVPIKYIADPDMFAMTRAALHPSQKYIAYQSANNEILVYSAQDKYRQNRKKSYHGHNSAGTAVGIDISPDGQFVSSGDNHGFVCFFDWKTCKMYEKLKADPSGGAVTCVEWHPQETSKVATAGSSGDIKFWD